MNGKKTLLAVIEFGGYPDFRPLYREAGFEVVQVVSVRRALAFLKQRVPDVVVAEFNFQSDFRDRTSSLESLLAAVQRHPETRVIVFYDPQHAEPLARLQARHAIHAALPTPVSAQALAAALAAAVGGGSSVGVPA
jgi:DNA-binding NarL/FixJ family response regulator